MGAQCGVTLDPTHSDEPFARFEHVNETRQFHPAGTA